jgi:hypothetical protein
MNRFYVVVVLVIAAMACVRAPSQRSDALHLSGTLQGAVFQCKHHLCSFELAADAIRCTRSLLCSAQFTLDSWVRHARQSCNDAVACPAGCLAVCLANIHLSDGRMGAMRCTWRHGTGTAGWFGSCCATTRPWGAGARCVRAPPFLPGVLPGPLPRCRCQQLLHCCKVVQWGCAGAAARCTHRVTCRCQCLVTAPVGGFGEGLGMAEVGGRGSAGSKQAGGFAQLPLKEPVLHAHACTC